MLHELREIISSVTRKCKKKKIYEYYPFKGTMHVCMWKILHFNESFPTKKILSLIYPFVDVTNATKRP